MGESDEASRERPLLELAVDLVEERRFIGIVYVCQCGAWHGDQPVWCMAWGLTSVVYGMGTDQCGVWYGD